MVVLFRTGELTFFLVETIDKKHLRRMGPCIRFSPEPKYNQQNLWKINLLDLLLKGTFGYVDNVGDMSYNNLNSASHKIKCHPEENE